MKTLEVSSICNLFIQQWRMMHSTLIPLVNMQFGCGISNICLSYVLMHAGRKWKVYEVAKTVFENNDTETRKSLQSDNGGKKLIIFLAFTLHFIHQAFLYMFALLS